MIHSHLKKRDPQRNQARFYHMAVLPNLFGEWTLSKEWGRIGSSGRVRLEWYRTRAEAEGELIKLETVKRRRGYSLEPQQMWLF